MKLWDERTELEKALLLVLCVTIPVNAILIYFYFYLMTHYPRVTSIKGAAQNGDYSSHDEINNPNKSILLSGPGTFIGSVSASHKKDHYRYEFRCPAVLLSSNYILASNDTCLEAENLQMRISSEYWFKDGLTREISSVLEPVKSKGDTKFYSIGKLIKPFPNVTYVRTIVYPTLQDMEGLTDIDSYVWNITYTNNKEDAKTYNRLQTVNLETSVCTRPHNGFCTADKSRNVYDLAFKSETDILIGLKLFGSSSEQYYGKLWEKDTILLQNITN